MDFFQSQENARRRTGRLLFLFLLAIALIVASLYFVILWASRWAGFRYELWQPDLFLGVAGTTVAIIAAGSLYRILQLRTGGSSVARMLGGRRVDLATTDLHERRLVNVVEEMAIASGVPVPEIFVMDGESGINAFAAGYAPGDAAVAVTRGCLEHLSRDELQGVIAHEFSHILNGDMRLNIRLVGILNGILLLHLIGYMLVRTLRHVRVGGSGRNKEGGGILVVVVVVGVALMVIGYIGVLCSRIIQAAVSRQREYLADAAAVQFTRNPQGISLALRKIGGASAGSRVRASHAMEASHMFFANGIVSSLSNIFATHPPLTQRIRALDPSFDGKSWIQPKKPAKRPPPRKRTTPPRRPSGPLDTITGPFPIQGEALLASIGSLSSAGISRAEAILARIPPELKEAVQDAAAAEAVVYGLLIGKDVALRERQIDLVRRQSPAAVAEALPRLLPAATALPPEARLPLAELALPALRQLSSSQFADFKRTVSGLVEGDNIVSIFEYAIEKMIRRHLDQHFGNHPRRTPQYYAPDFLVREISLLLSALAHAGEKNSEAAFEAGAARLHGLSRHLRLHPVDACTLEELDKALDQLDLASFPVKKKLLEAAIAVIISDGKVAIDEAELLRAFADSLDCPMPPIG